jgi:RNA polymerase sigma-70 factor (ECF subfamily)
VDDLQKQLEAFVAAGRLAWPTVALEDEVFVNHLAAHLPTTGDLTPALAKLRGADLYLACACTQGLAPAITAFEQRYMSRVAEWIAGIDQSSDFVDEVRQRLRERLLVGPRPRVADYNGSGPLEGWARVAATRVALNTRREWKRKTRLRVSSISVVQPDLDFIHGRYHAEIEIALKRALSRLGRPERELLRMHYIDGMNLQKIGELRKVDKSTISRHLASLRRSLLGEAKRELERLVPNVSTASRDSLLAAMRSKIDLSLTSALGR